MSPYAMLDPEEYYWMMETYDEEVEQGDELAVRVRMGMEHAGGRPVPCMIDEDSE
jgi:hypothetical protein